MVTSDSAKGAVAESPCESESGRLNLDRHGYRQPAPAGHGDFYSLDSEECSGTGE